MAKTPLPNLPTSHDVARLAGVSRATVSFVLNGRARGRVSLEAQGRVRAAAESLGYRPNRLATALSTGRTSTIGIVCQVKDSVYIADVPGQKHDVADAPGHYAKNMFLAVTLAAARVGLNATLFLELLDLELKPEDVADGRVDGIVIFGMYSHHDWVKRVASLQMPCVEIGTRWGKWWVEADNSGGTRLALEHLLHLGHRRIAHYIGLPAVPFIPTMASRATTFRAVTTEAQIPLCDAPIVHGADYLAALFDTSVPSHRQPTAIFTYNDAAAVEALDVLTAHGLRVPDDVSLVGFDNEIRSVTMRPALTTVQNPIDEIARSAVGLLRREIEERSAAAEGIIVPTQLIIRESTAAVAAPTPGTAPFVSDPRN
ncbi:MAG: LacI family DNA-binding transcriptional regulator [Armatimonadota bacterium]